jgi:hypothetical protein
MKGQNMAYDIISVLAPVAGKVIEKLMSGTPTKNDEVSFILLYSMARDISELKTKFDRFANDLTELRVAIARLNGKMQ